MKPIKQILSLAFSGILVLAVGVQAAEDRKPSANANANGSATQQNLSPGEMVARAQSYKPLMEKEATAVRNQLSVARRQKDVVKGLCLTDKVNQIELAIRTAGDRVTSLASAASLNDGERAKHEFTVIQVLKDRVSTLVSESNQCIGEETGFVGESNVTVTIDPNIPDSDPSDPPVDPIVSTPPVVSTSLM